MVVFTNAKSLKIRIRKALKVAIAFTPWLVSMYVFFWLHHSEIWTSETPHRGKISVAILAHRNAAVVSPPVTFFQGPAEIIKQTPAERLAAMYFYWK